MKLRLLHIVLLFVLALEGRADALGFSQEHPLKFGIDIDYPPMEYLDEQKNPAGFDITFTEILMQRLQIPMTLVPNTWMNTADDILKGQVDLGMMVYSSYRKNDAHFSRGVFRLYYQMVTRKDSKKIYGLRNLEGKTLAVMRSRPILDTLAASGAKTIITTNLSKAFRELSEGKYDAIICYRYQARYLIGSQHLDNLQAEDLALMPREYCYVSQNQELIEAINAELDKLEEENVIDDVYGDIKTQLGEIEIPVWVWYLLAAVIGFCMLAIIIQQRRNRQRLLKEVERSHKSEELKAIFLSNISHALRTPLNAIIGFSDLMLSDENDEIMPEERRNLMGLINENGMVLLHLINELLNLSDIEGKERFFNMELTDIVEEFDKYCDEIRPKLHPGVKLVVDKPADGIRAMVDRRFMRMVNMHLLENAMQHTIEGTITLSYYVKNGGIYAEVRDTGTGLPPELKENIFALLNDKNTYTQKDTPGLGLSICKAICDKMGGQIGARDNDIDGCGTIIWTWAEVDLR